MTLRIKSDSFGELISSVEGRLFGSHIPFFLSNDDESLMCHVSKKNPQWKETENQEVLVVFQGAHGYISPSWYGSPGVPTWNYQAVHVYGNARLISQSEELKEIVNQLTALYEAGADNPWSPDYNELL